MTSCGRRPRGSVTVVTGVLVLAVTVLVGCGNSSSKTSSSAAVASVTPSSNSAAASPSASPPSVSQLAKIVLQPADFPAGWEHKPSEPDANEAAEDAALARCLGSSLKSDRVAEVSSDDFSLGQAGFSSSAGSYRAQNAVDSHVMVLRGARAAPCYEQLLKQTIRTALPAGSTIESVSFKFIPRTANGPANVVETGAGTFTIRVSGATVVAHVLVAFITGPLIQAEVTGFNVAAPVSVSLMNSVVASVANRAAHP
jgi:hypothetical protein